ncbi:MAG: Ig-like domain-containing protein [Oscillospiraceae bacterium]|nr:Ig-like domain-containing protein [Oscillospiraceae bacterium]
MTRSNKLISLILAFLMFAGLISAPVIAETEPLGKTATLTDASFIAPIDPDIPSDAIHIQTPEELAAIGGAASEGKYYVLDNDINLVEEWMPIDDFRGTLDGQGYSVNNLWMAVEPPASSSHIGAGLFGKITKSVTIKNLGVNIGEQGITASAEDRFGRVSSGGLIGRFDGGDTSVLIIENCFVRSNVSEIPHDFLFPQSSGGLIGACYDGDEVKIKNSFTVGNIYARMDAGGLIGLIVAERGNILIERCYSISDVTAFAIYGSHIMDGITGGLVGDCWGSSDATLKIERSFTTGYIEGNMAGGLIGRIDGGIAADILNCYSGANIDATAVAGGLIGYCSNTTVKNCYAAGDSVWARGYFPPDPDNVYWAGGLIAELEDTVVTNSYRLSTQIINGSVIETAGEPLTESQMGSAESFDGWDFDLVWGYIGSNDFPVLRSFGSIHIAVSSATIMKDGESLTDPVFVLAGNTEQLTAKVAPFISTNKTVSWQSDNPAVATVDENGLVAGIAGGEATITVTTEDGGLTDSCTVKVSDAGIDFSLIPDIIIKGRIDDVESDEYFINLTDETITIPNTYTPAAYSINGGNKWKAIKDSSKSPFTKLNFPKMFNKTMTLHLSDMPIDKESKVGGVKNPNKGKPQTGATIVIFPEIHKRIPLPKLMLNYALGADKSNETTGTWLLAEKGSVASTKEGLVIAEADVSGKQPNENGFGKFIGKNGTNNGIVIKPLNSNNKQAKSTYLYKVGAVEARDGRYWAASKTKRATVKGQRKAPNYKVKDGVIKIKSGTSVVLSGTQTEYTEKTGINVADHASTAANLWLYATAKKPASKKQELGI